jgi:hypothetical protein
MQAAVRSSLKAGVALLGASVIAVTSVVPPPPEIRVAASEVRLAAATSLLNVPANLAIDLVNIPYNEMQALNVLSRSLFFSGPWFVPSATNVWGVDAGDPGHFMAVVDLLAPFPALSGLGLDQSDPNGLGQQYWHLAAAELPVSKYCDVSSCFPLVPAPPITGVTLVDAVIWLLASAARLDGSWVKFPLVDNYFKVPLSDLVARYTFGPDYPGYASTDGPVFSGFGFQGTTEVTGPNGPEYLMPWANTTFTLDLSKPFQNYFDHLMADPATNPIQLPTIVEFGRSVQALLAAMVVAFDPVTPGAGPCTLGPSNCSSLPPALDYPGIAQSIENAWPGNPLINEWLHARANGIANVPTKEQIDIADGLWKQFVTFWDFGNPSPPAELITAFNLNRLAPFFHKLWTDLGFGPPPLATPAQATGSAPLIAALKQKSLEGDVKLGPIPRGREGQKSGGVDARTDGPVHGLWAFEEASGPTLPQDESTTSLTTNATDDGQKFEPRDASDQDARPRGATQAAPGSVFTPQTALDRLPPSLKGPQTGKTGSTSSTDTGPNGSVPRTAPKTVNTPSHGNVLKRFLPRKAAAATTNPGAATSTDAQSKGIPAKA